MILILGIAGLGAGAGAMRLEVWAPSLVLWAVLAPLAALELERFMEARR